MRASATKKNKDNDEAELKSNDSNDISQDDYSKNVKQQMNMEGASLPTTVMIDRFDQINTNPNTNVNSITAQNKELNE